MKITPQAISLVLALVVVVASVAVMFGWILDISVLKSILPNWVAMKFITALSFLFSAFLIMFLVKKEKGEVDRFFILIISFILLLLMVTFIISLFVGISTGIENLFVKEETEAVGTAVPGVPAVPTIISFILVALAGLFYLFNPKNPKGIFSLGALIGLIGFFAFMGYLGDIPSMYYSFPGYTSMAFHTSILFTLLGVSLVLLKEESK